jgi:hypothetical protein
MARSSASPFVLANPPCEVEFAGWRSDTQRLGRCGWDVSIEEDLHRCDELHMLLFHQPSKLKVWARSRDRFNTRDWRGRGGMLGDLPVFIAEKAASDFRIVLHAGGEFAFKAWADTNPAMVEMSIHDTPLFLARETPKAEELIVDPQTVSDLLERIKQMQSPDQAEIRQRSRSQHAAPVAHATILSFAA